MTQEMQEAKAQFDRGDVVGRERTQIAVLRALVEGERQVRAANQDKGLLSRLDAVLDYLTHPRPAGEHDGSVTG